MKTVHDGRIFIRTADLGGFREQLRERDKLVLPRYIRITCFRSSAI